jgi:hypothetical protein
MERALVQAWTTKLLDASLVELVRGDYALAIVMLVIFGNWMERHMCGDYGPINKCTHSNKYAMLLLEKIFYALG